VGVQLLLGWDFRVPGDSLMLGLESRFDFSPRS
jgi:hypothetical protein